MDWIEVLKVILFGIVEGVTEWLPISSTGHMLLLDHLLPLDASAAFKEMFFVVIQLGAILAVLLLFRKRLFPFTIEKSDAAPRLTADKASLRLWGKIAVGCIPAALLGLIFDDFLEAHLHTPLVISLTLIGYGAAFIVVENFRKNKTPTTPTTAEISFKQAFLIGIFQSLSLIPGTSRSGATILGALLLGLSRPAGADFSFFLAIPVMFGASALKLVKFFLESGGFSTPEFFLLLIGSAVAFGVSILAIRFLTNFVKRRDFKPFGWYRILLGAAVIATLVLPSLLK